MSGIRFLTIFQVSLVDWERVFSQIGAAKLNFGLNH